MSNNATKKQLIQKSASLIQAMKNMKQFMQDREGMYLVYTLQVTLQVSFSGINSLSTSIVYKFCHQLEFKLKKRGPIMVWS